MKVTWQTLKLKTKIFQLNKRCPWKYRNRVRSTSYKTGSCWFVSNCRDNRLVSQCWYIAFISLRISIIKPFFLNLSNLRRQQKGEYQHEKITSFSNKWNNTVIVLPILNRHWIILPTLYFWLRDFRAILTINRFSSSLSSSFSKPILKIFLKVNQIYFSSISSILG